MINVFANAFRTFLVLNSAMQEINFSNNATQLAELFNLLQFPILILLPLFPSISNIFFVF